MCKQKEQAPNIPPTPKPKKLFGGGWRRPITDEWGDKWCNCDIPNLTSSFGRGLAWCMRCKTPWYH